MRTLSLVALAFFTAAPGGAADGVWRVVHPGVSDRILRNPDCGLAFMPQLTPVDQVPAWILDTCSIAYFRLDWAAVVDAAGVPQFEKLDREVFKGYRDRGLRLGFRIMAANPHSEQEYVTPRAIIERDHIPTVRHTSVYGKSAVDPVFWDERYLAAYNRLIAALGAYMDGRPWAGPVDLGGMGDWGEMHLSRWTQAQLDETGFTHERYLKAVLSMMGRMNTSLAAERRAFCYAPILMPDPVPVFDQLVAWATDRGWWLRNDGCTTDGPQPYLKPHLDRLWTRVGFSAEPNGAINNSGEGPNQVERWFRAQLSWHASVCNMMGLWDLKEFSAAEIEACRSAARRAGYRLAIDEAVLPRTVAADGGWLTGRIALTNRGVAPPYGSAAYLALELVRAGAVIARATLHPDPPLADLLPGTTRFQDVLVELPTSAPGAVDLRVAVVDPVHGPLQLGNDPQTADGWVALGSVTLAAGAATAHPLFDLATGRLSSPAGVTVAAGADGLSVKGTADAGWNYGWGLNDVKVAPHTVYVMRVKLRARPSAVKDSQLYFKFGVNRTDGTWAGNMNTAKYDFARAGEWQTLTAIYRPQPGDATFGIAIEKGRTAPASIDADLASWTVTAVAAP